MSYLSNRPLEIVWPVAQYLPVRRQTQTIQFCCVLFRAPTTPAEHSTLGMWYLHQVPSEFEAQSNRTHRPSQRWLVSTLWIRLSTECPSQVSIFRRISRRECRQVCESACSQCRTMTESCPAVADPIGIYRPIENEMTKNEDKIFERNRINGWETRGPYIVGIGGVWLGNHFCDGQRQTHSHRVCICDCQKAHQRQNDSLWHAENCKGDWKNVLLGIIIIICVDKVDQVFRTSNRQSINLCQSHNHRRLRPFFLSFFSIRLDLLYYCQKSFWKFRPFRNRSSSTKHRLCVNIVAWNVGISFETSSCCQQNYKMNTLY